MTLLNLRISFYITNVDRSVCIIKQGLEGFVTESMVC